MTSPGDLCEADIAQPIWGGGNERYELHVTQPQFLEQSIDLPIAGNRCFRDHREHVGCDTGVEQARLALNAPLAARKLKRRVGVSHQIREIRLEPLARLGCTWRAVGR